jgi:hypothetical protein
MRRPSLRSTALAALLGAFVIGAAGCVSTGRPESCEAESVTVDVVLTADALEPSDPAACRGQQVMLVVDSEIDGLIHVHGYDHAVPATEVSAGDETTLSFTADRSGQFPIELHPLDDPQGVDVGIFTVHEP